MKIYCINFQGYNIEVKLMECPNKTKNLEMCNCEYECERKGICCECVAYHKKNGGVPMCLK